MTQGTDIGHPTGGQVFKSMWFTGKVRELWWTSYGAWRREHRAPGEALCSPSFHVCWSPGSLAVAKGRQEP